MRVLFMGSPGFAVPSLLALADHYEMVGVVTQPDRPAGRGRQPRSSPVKEVARARGLPILQPESLRPPPAVQAIADRAPDLIVVAAYGLILPESILRIPARGCLNVHASLLPRWRGASPVQAAILEGDPETGVTIMQMDPGLDTGPIVAQRRTAIGATETGGQLADRLSQLGAALLIEVLPGYLDGIVRTTPQDNQEATLAPRLRKSSGWIDLRQPAARLTRQVRAFNPWPGSFLRWNGRRLIVHRARAEPEPSAEPGRPVSRHGLPALSTGEGLLVLMEVQLEGRKTVDGEAFLRGYPSFLDAEFNP